MDSNVEGFLSRLASYGYEVMASYPGYIYFSNGLSLSDKDEIDKVARNYNLLGVVFHRDNGIDYITYRPLVVSKRGVY